MCVVGHRNGRLTFWSTAPAAAVGTYGAGAGAGAGASGAPRHADDGGSSGLSTSMEREHKDCVTAMDWCGARGLLVTSSLDGMIKIWNSRRQLVRDIATRQALLACCFLNASADIVVGIRSNVSVIRARHYLPSEIMRLREERRRLRMEGIGRYKAVDPDADKWWNVERKERVLRDGVTRCSVFYFI
jgi:hypothetical protein